MSADAWVFPRLLAPVHGALIPTGLVGLARDTADAMMRW